MTGGTGRSNTVTPVIAIEMVPPENTHASTVFFVLKLLMVRDKGPLEIIVI